MKTIFYPKEDVQLRAIADDMPGYIILMHVAGRGICGVRQMLFTFGLFYGCSLDHGEVYKGRYCYTDPLIAISALVNWDGTGHPPFDWVKHFGAGGEFANTETKQYANG